MGCLEFVRLAQLELILFLADNCDVLIILACTDHCSSTVAPHFGGSGTLSTTATRAYERPFMSNSPVTVIQRPGCEWSTSIDIPSRGIEPPRTKSIGKANFDCPDPVSIWLAGRRSSSKASRQFPNSDISRYWYCRNTYRCKGSNTERACAAALGSGLRVRGLGTSTNP